MLQLTTPELSYCKQKIEDFIAKEVEKAKARGGIVALSGGIDSSLIATLASRVIDLKALILPEVGVNRPEDIEDAKSLVKTLEIDYEVIEINPILEKIKEARAVKDKIAWANVKPRVRMLLNYLVANEEKRIVLGTGNKTELLLGYFTKYGDGGVDILPIGDLYKTQVRQLARFVGVPEKIIEKPPSAGLWKGQTDEAELGATYEVMDRILYLLVDKGLAKEKVAEELGIELSLVERLERKMEENEHKRKMPKILKIF